MRPQVDVPIIGGITKSMHHTLIHVFIRITLHTSLLPKLLSSGNFCITLQTVRSN